MTKALKIAGIVVAVVVALLAGLAVVAKIVITPDRVKSTLIPIAEKKLHRQVQLGEIKVSIFSGIILKKLVVQEKEGGEPFVAAEQVKLRYQFWPLLSKRVVVDEIGLDAPRIRVIRMPDGTFNYSDILAKKEQPAEAKPPAGGGVNLLVSKIAVTNGEVHFEDRAGKPPATYTIAGIDFSASDIALDKTFPFSAKARLTGLSVEVKGKASNLSAKPTIDAVVRLSDVDLRKLAAGLPPGLAVKAKPYDPAGSITARLHLAGPVAAPKELLKDGEIKLSEVQATLSGQRPSLAGDVTINATSASSRNLTLTMGQNKLKIAFNAANLTGKPISVASSVTADRFDLDPFLKKGPGPAAAPTGGGVKPEPGPMNLPVRATGTAQLGQTTYKGLPVTRLLLKYRLIDNILTIDELRGNVAGGSFSDTARVDLGQKGFAYSSHLAVQGVQANPVVSAFAPKAAGTVSGVLSLNTDLKGRGTQSAAIKKNLGGQGDFAIANGKITGGGVVQGLAQYLGLEQLRVLQFNKFGGTFRIENGKIVLDSSASGKDVQFAAKGTAGLDETLDLSLPVRLSPDLTHRMTRGEIGRYITDDKGWGLLPLKVTGTASSPKFRPDVSAVREQMKGKVKEKLQQTIEEKLLKKKEGGKARPEQELLEKGMKGILGK